MVRVDNLHNFDSLCVSRFSEFLDGGGVDVESSGLVYEIDDSEPGEEGVRGDGGGLPESCVDGHATVWS